jgi:excisionase family DNA binding protein
LSVLPRAFDELSNSFRNHLLLLGRCPLLAGIGLLHVISNPGVDPFAGTLLKETLVSTNSHRPHRRPRPEQRPGRPITSSTSEPIPAPGESNQLLYTPAEAADKLRVRESWLRRRAAARQIPCTFLGKHLRFSDADLAGIVAQNAQAPTGRRPRRRSSTVRDRDLPPPPVRSVHPPDRHDHNRDDGSSPWLG